MRKALFLLIPLLILPVSANDFTEVADLKVTAFYSEDNGFIYAITRNQTRVTVYNMTMEGEINSVNVVEIDNTTYPYLSGFVYGDFHNGTLYLAVDRYIFRVNNWTVTKAYDLFPGDEENILPRAIDATDTGIYTVVTDGGISRFDPETGELHHILYFFGAIGYASDGEFIYILKAGRQSSRGRSTPGMLKIYNTSGVIVGEQQADGPGVLEGMFVRGDNLYAVDNRKLYSLFLNPSPAFPTEDIPFGIVGAAMGVMFLVRRKIRK